MSETSRPNLDEPEKQIGEQLYVIDEEDFAEELLQADFLITLQSILDRRRETAIQNGQSLNPDLYKLSRESLAETILFRENLMTAQTRRVYRPGLIVTIDARNAQGEVETLRHWFSTGVYYAEDKITIALEGFIQDQTALLGKFLDGRQWASEIGLIPQMRSDLSGMHKPDDGNGYN